MALVFWLLAALVPYLIGMGTLRVLYRGRALQEMTFADKVLTGGMICIGLAETAHLGAVVLGWSFSRCVLLFGIAVIFVTLGAVSIEMAGLLLDRKKGISRNRNPRNLTGKKGELSAYLPMGIFVLLIVCQLTVIWNGQAVYADGDMTLETVVSFLRSDALYEINPMTGSSYVLGIPSRLKILCLPSLYGALCSIFALEPATLVMKMIPVLVLVGSYLAYYTLARYFFPKNVWKRGVFLAIAALLIGAGDYLYGMDGFGLLHSGFRGVSIRGTVLLPYLFGLLLRRKYRLVPFCILAEACIVWTLYGIGVCAVVTGGMLAVMAISGKEADRVGTSE